MATARRGDDLQRSEQLRQERAERRRRRPVNNRKKSRSQKFSAETGLPPVMVRGKSATNWFIGSKRRSGSGGLKRRYDFALGSPGAEMRLPAIPAVRLDWRLLSFILTAAILFGLYHLWNAPEFRVTEVKISGLNRISTEVIRTVLNIDGDQVFLLDPGHLEARLSEAFPEFMSVEVSVDWPAEVVIQVEERAPLMTWRQGGINYLVDAEGVMFRLRENGPPPPDLAVEALSAPPVQRLDPEDRSSLVYMPAEMVSAILSLGAHAPSGAQIVYDQIHGLGWRAPQGWEVYFGDVGDIGNKLQVYTALVHYLQRKDLAPILISVEQPHLPYYRLGQ